ncbi:hypothetical protein AB0395_28910 [Streptosporangium sp. NPDC051023]|uniref:hypothetical protein n=1 Tax=Streptosporangium sp. NPDC051023 TaxID=3155410 RepID=UPI00344CAE7A
MSSPERTWPVPVHRGGGVVVVVLPLRGRCDGTVRAAAAYAMAAESRLTFALIMPQPDLASASLMALPYTELWFDYELEMTTELSELLFEMDVRWSMVPVYHPPRDMLSLVRAVDADVVLVHDCGRTGRLSLERWRTRRMAALLADNTDAVVHLVCAPWNEPLVP